MSRVTTLLQHMLLSAKWQETCFYGFWVALRCLVNDTSEASSTNLFLSGLFPSALKRLNLRWSTESPRNRVPSNHSFNDDYVSFWQIISSDIADSYIRCAVIRTHNIIIKGTYFDYINTESIYENLFYIKIILFLSFS